MYSPSEVCEPAVQITGGAGECVRDEAVETVEAVNQKLPLCMTFSQNIALIGKNHIQNLFKLILDKKGPK